MTTEVNSTPIPSSQGSTGVQTRMLPVPDWGKHHPWPSVAGLRWMIFNAKATGLDRCIHRVGRRVLIDESAFFDWVKQQSA